FLPEESLSKQALIAAQLFTKIIELDYKSTFRIGVQANCPELIPFYPASYYKGTQPKYALGIQTPTTINQIANFNLSFDEIFDDLFDKINVKLMEFENKITEKNEKYEYEGIDSSFAPMVEEKDSIGAIYEKILKDKIGSYKTLTATAKFTEIAKNLNIKKTGFCGMMLPPLEDSILAKRFSEGELTIQKLLYYSSVCACGLDTIPVSSKVSKQNIADIYLDMATLAYKHNKPLSVRLMSIPNSKPGDMTTFDSPYICNTKLII
ncbi:DUF711 family protein, partial [Candidatus Dojkabacteria bacterium]|nr:DUF711 family protein [Candidatus Dojkabacteria bacterium]